MIKHYYRSLLIKIFFILTSKYLLFGELIERGDPNFRRKTDIDINKIRTTIFNHGITGVSI